MAGSPKHQVYVLAVPGSLAAACTVEQSLPSCQGAWENVSNLTGNAYVRPALYLNRPLAGLS